MYTEKRAMRKEYPEYEQLVFSYFWQQRYKPGRGAGVWIDEIRFMFREEEQQRRQMEQARRCQLRLLEEPGWPQDQFIPTASRR